MQTSGRLRLFATVASVAAVALTAACGSDSTSSNSQTPSQLAAHFDSIYVQAAAQANTEHAYSVRTLLATFLELPAALGASPATVTVTTASGTEHWKAFEILERSSAGATTQDSTYLIVAYRDPDAHTVLVADVDHTGNVTDGGIITGDTISVAPTSVSGSTSLRSVGNACGTPSASLHNPQLGTLGIATCTFATFNTSMSLTLAVSGNVDPALASVSFSNATITGVRAVDAENGATIRQVKAMLHALQSEKKL